MYMYSRKMPTGVNCILLVYVDFPPHSCDMNGMLLLRVQRIWSGILSPLTLCPSIYEIKSHYSFHIKTRINCKQIFAHIFICFFVSFVLRFGQFKTIHTYLWTILNCCIAVLISWNSTIFLIFLLSRKIAYWYDINTKYQQKQIKFI